MAANFPMPTLATVTNDIRDIKPPVGIPSGLEWLWVAIAILVSGALCYVIWRFVRKRLRQKPVAPPEPAHVRAKRKLVDALALINQPEAFVVAVSSAVRVYLEERFNLHAPERTTEEFLHDTADSPVLTERQKTSLADFLVRSDLVKFARYVPCEPELRDLHAAAVRFVEETAPMAAVQQIASGEITQQTDTRLSPRKS